MLKVKRIQSLLLAAAVMSLIGACSKNQIVSTYSPRQIAEAIMYSQASIAPLHALTPDDDYFSDYVINIYQMNSASIEDGTICYAYGMSADEIAVFIVSDNTALKETREKLNEYIKQRAAAFSGYAPHQSAIAENGVVAANGNYIALIICEDTKSAESTFAACFSGDPPKLPDRNNSVQQQSPDEDPPAATDDPEATAKPEPPAADVATVSPEPETDNEATDDPDPAVDIEATDDQEPETDNEAAANPEPGAGNGTAAEPEAAAEPDDLYDPAAILAAWRNVDASALSGKNRIIYDACKSVINKLITDNMTDYDKELALHDWIIEWASYDTETLSNSPNAHPDPDNDNPYGLLINKKAICLGYTLTFQLFMDLVGVECITVHGTSHSRESEHAWNMVRIDGEWYCVDVTWNDPIESNNIIRIGSPAHKFFNVTSKFMWDTDHQWDRSAVPEATAPKLYKG